MHPSSHKSIPKPSAFLALVSLAIVHRLRPEWVCVPLHEAARTEGVSPERLSRLATRSIEPFESVVRSLTKIGRPPIDRAIPEREREVSLLSALLGVAALILRTVSFRRAAVRQLILGAFARLRIDHPGLTQKRFAESLGLSERTLRNWKKQPARRPVPASSSPGPSSDSAPHTPKRPPRRPRFGFDVTLPDTQIAADTTDLSAFGVPLKWIAAQVGGSGGRRGGPSDGGAPPPPDEDVGGRDADLFDGVVVDTAESADRIRDLLTQVLSPDGGEQVVTDQGTPFMAGELADALDQLGAEHAPQREGDPLGKATIERAFRTVKDIARPFLQLTNHLASILPRLARPDLAKATVKLVMCMLLRAYQAGARATRRAIDARGGMDESSLAHAAEESRRRARATDRSAKLLLARVHETFQLPGTVTAFVRAFRAFPISVLQAAEQAFASQAHREDIADGWKYFAAIVSRLHRDHSREVARGCADLEQLRRSREESARHANQLARRMSDPASWLRKGLELIAAHWRPARGTLLFDGVGAGTGTLRAAVDRLVELHGPVAALDMARGVLQDFSRHPPPELESNAIPPIVAVATRTLDDLATTLGDNLHFTGPPGTGILPRAGSKPRPGPPPALRS